MKLGLAADKLYSAVDTIAAVSGGVQQAYNLATNAGSMTGWQIAGNVAQIGLNFAPALGAIGGAALKRAGLAEGLNFAGCFVAGTLVRVETSGIRLQASGGEMVAVQRELSGVMIEPEGFVSFDERLMLAAVSSDLEWNHRATAFTEFESSAVDHALVDYEADSFDDLFLTPEASSLQPPVSGLLPIEAVPLGARIATKNPRDWEVQPSVAVAGEAWYEIHATIVRTDGNRVEVELLRPESWVREEGLEVGGEIRLRLAELNVDGLAVITKLDRRDDIDQSDIELGNLVTGRFKTLGAMNVVQAIFSDGTEIVGTDIHPVWSVDRQDWIALGELQEYERVQTRSGTIHLLSLQAALPADVFNIEVDCHHVYEVGDVGVLVHNQCHHVVSHYSNAGRGWTRNWSAEGRQILENADIKLHGKINKQFIEGHTGPHPELYHQRVFQRLEQAIEGLRPHTEEYTRAATAEINLIVSILRTNPKEALKGIGL